MGTEKNLTREREVLTVKRLALLSILVALSYVGRIIFQFLPNVQPMTAILLIITLILGTRDGIIVSIASLVLSNLVLGMGPWIFGQIASYAFLISFTGIVLRPLYEKKNMKIVLTVYAFLAGILYGLVISVFSYKMFGMSNFWAYYTLGIPFDLMHAFGNAVFYIILEPILAPLIKTAIKKS